VEEEPPARYVAGADLNKAEIVRRGGTSADTTDLFVFRCATCGRVFLADAAAETAYPDPADLSKHREIGDWLPCPGCGALIEAEAIWAAWRGDPAAEAFRVRRDELEVGPWAWALRKP
jgi:hypothetical protein